LNVAPRNRTIALSALLAVLALTASGCQVAQNPAVAGAQAPSPAATTRTLASSLDPETARLGETWVNMFGEDRALATPAAEVGNKVVNLTFDRFPQYTLGGFDPTQDDFNQVIAVAKTFMTADVIQTMESEWASKKDLPAMRSGRTDKDGNFSQTYVTEAGESCTDSDKPYEVKPLENVLLTIPDENEVELPSFLSQVEVTMHCKEGGLLRGQVQVSFSLVQENGTWLVSRSPQVKPAAPFTMVS
jgi:hypothetical protein